ncbi:hypothetical protein ACHAP7_011681 [Fusarium lateritium]
MQAMKSTNNRNKTEYPVKATNIGPKAQSVDFNRMCGIQTMHSHSDLAPSAQVPLHVTLKIEGSIAQRWQPGDSPF